LLELIKAEIDRSGHLKELGAGLVLVGGGAKLRNLVPQAEQALGLPVRVGCSMGLENMDDQLAGPEFAVLVGLAIYGNRRRLLLDSQDTGVMSKLWRALRGKGGS